MKRKLKNSVIEHLESVQLDEHRLQALLRLQRQPTKTVPLYRKAMPLALAAGLLIVFALSWHLRDPPDLLRAIAEEAVMNHLMDRPLEVRGASIAAVEAYFDRLDFRLVESKWVSDKTRLLGGRYCSIRGVTAAQLRHRDRAGATTTLYQVPHEPAIMGGLPAAGDKPYTLQVRGLHVDLWVERGLLFALTREQ